MSGGTDKHATWDAAYVLGSLPRAQRHEFETHLSACASCRNAVGELAGMPSVLSLLSADDVRVVDEGDCPSADVPALRTQVLASLLAALHRR